MLARLQSMRAKTVATSDEAGNSSPNKQAKRGDSKKNTDYRLGDEYSGDPTDGINQTTIRKVDYKHKRPRSSLPLEDFEKEVDITARAKNFRFDADDEEITFSTASQRADAAEGDERPSKAAVSSRKDEELLNEHEEPETNDQGIQQDRRKSHLEEKNLGEQEPAKPPESLLGTVRKPIKSIETLDEGEVDTFGEREEEDQITEGLDVKYRDDVRFQKIQFMIFPDDVFKDIWNVIIALNLAYTATILPYTVSFLDENNDTFAIFDYVSDGIWALDIVITFFSAYEDKEDNLVVSRKKIFLNYVLGWFIPDVLSIMPFDLLFDLDKSFNSLIRIAKLPKLARFLRLAKLVRMLRFMKEGNKIARQVVDWLKFRPGLDRFFMTIAIFFISCHVACCIWYLQAGFNSDDSTNWVQSNGLSNQEAFAVRFFPLFRLFIGLVLYFFFLLYYSHCFDCGVWRYTCRQYTGENRIIAVFFMFVGAIFYSVIIGSLSSVILNLDSKHRDLEKKLNTLIEIRQKYSLDNMMFNKIKRALKYGYSRNEEDNIHFLNNLPLPLRTKLSVIMHKDVLKNIIFFKPKTDKFLATIGPLLKSLKVGINEYIFTEGEYANEMYFIKSGTVQMVIKEYNNFPFMYIEQGYYFGEVDLLFGETRKHSYQAKSECELLCLNKKNFTKIFFQDFPEVGAEIYNNALKRRVRSHKTYKEALAQCQTEAKEKGKRKKMFTPKISTIPKMKIGLGDENIGNEPDQFQEPSEEEHHSHDHEHNNHEHGYEEKSGTPQSRNENRDDAPMSLREETFSMVTSSRKLINYNEDNLEGQSQIQVEEEKQEHKEQDSVAKTEKREEGALKSSATKGGDNELNLTPKVKKKALGKWSLLKNKFEPKAHPFEDEKPLDLNTLLNPEAPQSANKDQLALLQQRVDQIEKSLEKILEFYQSVIPKEEGEQ